MSGIFPYICYPKSEATLYGSDGYGLSGPVGDNINELFVNGDSRVGNGLCKRISGKEKLAFVGAFAVLWVRAFFFMRGARTERDGIAEPPCGRH